jgi:hypothetical protein
MNNVLQNSGRQIIDVITRATDACSSNANTSIWGFLFSIVITIRLVRDSVRQLGGKTPLLGNPRDVSKKALELEYPSPFRGSVKEHGERSPMPTTYKRRLWKLSLFFVGVPYAEPTGT